MEEQHPIPQQISAYQFRLVGDMTLKQFFQVAGGALVALVLYSSSLPSYVKWPLILLAFLFGVALAFFPLEDRPLSKWIILFIKAIYSPTIYSWRKTNVQQSYFQPEPGALPTIATGEQAPGTTEVDMTGKIAAITPPETQKLEEKEQKFLTHVSQELTPAQPNAPHEEVVQRKSQAVAGKIEVPNVGKVEVEKSEKPEETHQPSEVAVQTPQGYQVTPSVGQQIVGAKTAQFSEEAAPPIPPTNPNVIVGQVVDPEGKIIENAILEIRDSEGRPVRALKSNKVGHFMIVTPLENGKYELTTEKEDYKFDPLTFEAQGNVIPPIAIWAREKIEVEKSDNKMIQQV